MSQVMDQVREMVAGYVPTLLLAFAVLVVGWLVALVMAAATRAFLGRTRLDERLTGVLQVKDPQKTAQARRITSRVVFYVTMLLVVVAFLRTLGLTSTIEPLNRLLNQVFTFLPLILAASVLLLVGWIIATFLRFFVVKTLSAVHVDERLGTKAGFAADQDVPLTRTLGEAIYWLTLLLFLPAILNALQMDGLLGPVQVLLDEVLGYLPNIITAALILLIGWLGARIAQRVVSNVLVAVGTDRLSSRVGMSSILGRQDLSGTIGLVVYVLILLPVMIAALNALDLEAVSQPASNMLEVILGSLPVIAAAMLVVGIAYVVARVVAGLISRLLASAGFDNLVGKLGLHISDDERRTPSGMVRYVIIFTIMLFSGIEAFAVLGFEEVSNLLAQLASFSGEVLLGLIILGGGLYLARLANDAVRESGVAHATSLATIARVAIQSLTVAMALTRMGMATEIIELAFGLVLGAIAIAGAIAFGLGGKEAAARFLENRGFKGK